MIRRGSYGLVVLPRQCPTNLVSKRRISLLRIGRNEEESYLSVRRPWFCCGAGKQMGIRRVKILSVVKRSVASKADLGQKMILEVMSDVTKKQEKNTDMNAVREFDSMDDFQEMKNLIGNSSLKEHNLEYFWKLSKGNPETFNTLRSWQMKIDILSKMLGVVPNMGDEKWLSFLKETQACNERLLTYVMTAAVKKQKEKMEKIQFKDVYDAEDDSFDEQCDRFDDPMCYHLFHNSMFLNLRIKVLRKLWFSKAMSSVLYGPELFVDCSYDTYMRQMEAKNLSKQIIEGVNKNLRSSDPFHIVLCNFNKNGVTGRSMLNYSKIFYADNFPVTITSKSYLDFVPREKLVYLTPHCSKVMTEFDPNKRYIIGGYVDKTSSEHVSLAKAKENKIEMMKFPLDKYLDWQQGKKTLCVNHCIFIMLTLKNSKRDWLKAFEVLPRRNFIKKEPGSAKNKKVPYIYSVCRMINRLSSGNNPNNFVS